jgi:CHAD domain-containing protein
MASDTPVHAGEDEEIEVEWQFDALDLRPVERWLAALPQRPPDVVDHLAVTARAKAPRRLADQYLDTEDWRIGRAGFVLRTRRRGRSEETTLKDTRPAGAGGLRQRLEVTQSMPAGGLGALDQEGPVGRRVAAMAGRRPLRQVLEVRTRRRPFALLIDGQEVAELALDETMITGGADEPPVRLRRVEVEVASEWMVALEPLVVDLQNTCGLRPASLSKFEAGLLALGMRIPGPPDLGSTQITRDSTLGDVAYAVIRRHLGVMLEKEPGTRLGEDIEELHEMRVATRRLRAAIDFFEDVLPARAKALREELTWVAGVLGTVRDLDVQIERTEGMDEWAATWVTDPSSPAHPLQHLRDLLMAQRTAGRAELLTALDSTRWERLVSGLTVMVSHSPNRRSPAVRLPAVVALPELVMDRHRAVVKAARRAKRTGIITDFHRLRIRCKRLRYSLEFTAGVYGGRTVSFTRQLAKLQDSLGLMQDAEVGANRLLSLAVLSSPEPPATPLPAATIFAMGAVAERYRVEAEELLAQMPGRLRVLEGREWKDLTSHMRRRRIEATPSEPARRITRPAAAVTPPVTVPELTLEVALEPTGEALVTALTAWPDPAWEVPPAMAAGPALNGPALNGPALNGPAPAVAASLMEEAPGPPIAGVPAVDRPAAATGAEPEPEPEPERDAG